MRTVLADVEELNLEGDFMEVAQIDLGFRAENIRESACTRTHEPIINL